MMRRSKATHMETTDFLDLLDESVVTIGLDKRVRYINRAAEKMLGYTLEEARSQPCSTIVHCAECDTHCHLDNALRTGEAVDRYETSLLNRLGKSIKVRLSSTLLEDDQGHIIGGVEVIQNALSPAGKNGGGRNFVRGMFGEGDRMQEADSVIRAAAKKDHPVLILGEAGTGKDAAARVIHEGSARKAAKFFKVNCGGFPSEVISRELFGYKANAFPGAFSDKEGLIETASGGTLYLEGVESLDPEVQKRLLGVLQTGRLDLPGLEGGIPVDVRIMASAGEGLPALAGEGRFLPELLASLCGFRITLPPLRERREDVPFLARHFMETLNSRLGKKVKSVSSKAMEALLNYSYPGNVSELEKIIEHAMVLCRGRTLQPEHLPKNLFRLESESMEAISREADPLSALERQLFLKVLSESRWNQKIAATRLKISRTTLWRRLRELGIDPSLEQRKR
ncbi:MAG TPA: sigma 54-interacting transcriptional regulator [Nitrospiria bacterium]